MRRAGRAAPSSGGLAAVDYDLHGLVRVRLVDAAPGDTAAVDRQLGPIRAPVGGEPDLVVRFVERLATERLRYLGAGEAAFTDDAFLLLRSKYKAPARVRLPLADIGGHCEIVCERGLPAVPLLVPIVNLTVLAKGALPLHASAFVHEGTGVVATGWSKGGKTEALLAFTAKGARYVGDEWVYVSHDGSRVYGIPEPIRLWDWHLRQLPAARALVTGGDRARLRILRLGLLLGERLAGGGALGRPLRAFHRARPLLERQLHVDVAPERLFPGATAGEAPFDRLFFVMSHESPEVVVEAADPLDVARRMAHSLRYERLDLAACYAMYRFAFPDRESPIFELAEERERRALETAFAGKPTFLVRHPYPVSIPELFDAMSPYCGGERKEDADV